MLAIISAPGSRGDVNPMIAIGQQLRRRGFDVVISVAEPYADIARQADLQAEAVIDRKRFQQILSNPNLWKPFPGVRAILRDVSAEFLPLHDAVIRRHHRPGQTVLVSHPLDFASRVFRELDPTTPLVDIHLAPSILRTHDSPPRLTPWRFELSRPAWAIRGMYWLADRLGADPVIGQPVNRLRRQYGLAPISRILDAWWLSPDRIVAMYPRWFAPATEQFCPRLVHVGFPLCDADDRDYERPTNRPIVFTAGTANHHCREFFAHAVQTCQKLARPGLLVSTHEQNFPQTMPSSVRAISYVSFGQLLPDCRAIVHHGGIGTTSQALAAGIPQLVRPLAFDQFDNATRVQRLECGVWLRRDNDLAETLAQTIDSEVIRDSCAEIAARLQTAPAAIAAADQIQQALRDAKSNVR